MEQPEIPTLKLAVPSPCMEVHGMLGSMYLRCMAPSTMLIFHEKDNRVYPMCEECGTHNRDNRGGLQMAVLA